MTAEGLRLPPVYRLVALEEVASTNDEARRLARDGAPEGTVVWARAQTGGRGRMGRAWASPRGNLYMSLVLRPDCALAEAALLSFVAAVGLGEALGTVLPALAEVRFKWPNDILLNGRKCAGILLESDVGPDGRPEFLVMGIGVNLVTHPEATTYPATDLAFEGAPPVAPEVVLQAFCRHFLVWSARWLDEGFAPVRRRWLAHAAGRGDMLTVALPGGGGTITGRFADLDESGALVLEADAGRHLVHAGDVLLQGGS
ncbi:MAG: biotin--[acetyl-CoA-carboxylase] ligase [Thalassobaculales bacterium]